MPDREQMLKRQKVLADFGEFALRCEDLDQILMQACRLVGEALGTDLAKVLEIEEGGDSALVRAGVGWNPGVVGCIRLRLDERSSESFSLKVGRPVISRDIDADQRFDFPDFMKAHGTRALVNVPIFVPGGKAYGLLQVDSREPRDFDQGDVEFLRTYAMILGPVIDRLHKAHDLKAALKANNRLLQELQHRIKNHIGIITGLVRMRERDAPSPDARRELAAIGERVETLRLLHHQLYADHAADRLRLRPYLVQLIENLCRLHQGQSGPVRLDVDVEDLDLAPETAVPLGLIVNEFTTNSLKYAFDGAGGTIALQVEGLAHGGVRVRIADDGKGLPPAPPPRSPGSGTGLRLIDGLAHQIGAKPVWSSQRGTSLCLEFTRV